MEQEGGADWSNIAMVSGWGCPACEGIRESGRRGRRALAMLGDRVGRRFRCNARASSQPPRPKKKEKKACRPRTCATVYLALRAHKTHAYRPLSSVPGPSSWLPHVSSCGTCLRPSATPTFASTSPSKMPSPTQNCWRTAASATSATKPQRPLKRP